MDTPATPFDWNTLLLYMKERRVVPVVGAEAISISAEGQTLPLERYLARQLIDRLGMEAASSDAAPSLSDVANEFIRQYRGERKKLKGCPSECCNLYWLWYRHGRRRGMADNVEG